MTPDDQRHIALLSWLLGILRSWAIVAGSAWALWDVIW